MENKNKKMLKVVYFDEGSAIDYLDVFHGGLVNKIQDKKKSKKSIFRGSANVKATTGILFKVLEPFLNINAGGGIDGSLSRIGESVIKTTISNTVLSDYVKTAEEDENVIKLQNYRVSAYKNSISFMKMYTPYFNMIKMENEAINFSKIDETLEKSKGYYELLAKNHNSSNIVLRFNIKAFRNSYNLVDLTRMNLKFYSIKVGKMDIAQLNVEKEFDIKGNDEIVTSADILSSKIDESSIEVLVYDVILAGIQANE